MPRAKSVPIGNKSFATQSAADAFVKEILNSQPLGTPIPEPDHTFLLDLIAGHPRSAEKIGSGVKHFTVQFALHGTRCFYITRTDGTKTDFSYFKCVRRKE